MAASTVFEKQAGSKIALGLPLQFISLFFLVPVVRLTVRQFRMHEAREGLVWAGCFITLGWLLEQWEAGRWPRQQSIAALWKTRWGNLALSLLLAGAAALLALVAINATLWLTGGPH
ncbi:MAG: hypothetical protein V4671_09480 [Armatimonadota bacterium]